MGQKHGQEKNEIQQGNRQGQQVGPVLPLDHEHDNAAGEKEAHGQAEGLEPSRVKGHITFPGQIGAKITMHKDIQAAAQVTGAEDKAGDTAAAWTVVVGDQKGNQAAGCDQEAGQIDGQDRDRETTASPVGEKADRAREEVGQDKEVHPDGQGCQQGDGQDMPQEPGRVRVLLPNTDSEPEDQGAQGQDNAVATTEGIAVIPGIVAGKNSRHGGHQPGPAAENRGKEQIGANEPEQGKEDRRQGQGHLGQAEQPDHGSGHIGLQGTGIVQAVPEQGKILAPGDVDRHQLHGAGIKITGKALPGAIEAHERIQEQQGQEQGQGDGTGQIAPGRTPAHRTWNGKMVSCHGMSLPGAGPCDPGLSAPGADISWILPAPCRTIRKHGQGPWPWTRRAAGSNSLTNGPGSGKKIRIDFQY